MGTFWDGIGNAGMVGDEMGLCGDGWGWGQRYAGMFADGFKVCRDGRGWRQKFVPVQVSVLLSQQNLGTCDVMAGVIQTKHTVLSLH